MRFKEFLYEQGTSPLAFGILFKGGDASAVQWGYPDKVVESPVFVKMAEAMKKAGMDIPKLRNFVGGFAKDKIEIKTGGTVMGPFTSSNIVEMTSEMLSSLKVAPQPSEEKLFAEIWKTFQDLKTVYGQNRDAQSLLNKAIVTANGKRAHDKTYVPVSFDTIEQKIMKDPELKKLYQE